MAAVAKGVALSFGLISASVSMESAVLAKEKTGNVLVCDSGHPPQQIRQPRVCDQCAQLHESFGEIAFQQTKKARPVGDGYVVLEDDEIAAASEDVSAFKKKASVTAHPVEGVFAQTSTGDKAYFLIPDKGHEQAYSTLLGLVAKHPELAFMTQWTPRTALAQFRLSVYKDVLFLQERVEGGGLRLAPQVPLEFSDTLLGLAEQVLALPGSVSEYDPATYRSTFEEKIAEIVAKKEVVTLEGVAGSTGIAPAIDLAAALQAQLDAAAKPKRSRKKVNA